MSKRTQWQMNRCFVFSGFLYSSRGRLRQIERHASTLPSEAMLLNVINKRLDKLILGWKKNHHLSRARLLRLSND